MNGAEPLFPPLRISERLAELARTRGWPEDLTQQLADLRPSSLQLDEWSDDERPLTVDQLRAWAERHGRLTSGSLRARKATVGDWDVFADLWANAPTAIGDWEVTVERSPNPFAQWRLQENVEIDVLEDRGLLLACQANSRRNVLVDGQRLTVSLPQAVRVRREFGGMGYSRLLMDGGVDPHPNAPLQDAVYFYVRTQNFSSYEWLKVMRPGFLDDAPPQEGDVPGIAVCMPQIMRAQGCERCLVHGWVPVALPPREHAQRATLRAGEHESPRIFAT
ncbi:MAG: hypothetical protein ACRDVP_04790 [Acidimicrobiales bacterium]